MIWCRYGDVCAGNPTSGSGGRLPVYNIVLARVREFVFFSGAADGGEL